jgi:hypothetical protein
MNKKSKKFYTAKAFKESCDELNKDKEFKKNFGDLMKSLAKK